MDKVGTDFFHLHGHSYILVVDYTTKFFDLNRLPNAESSTVIANLKSIFAKYGIPQIVVSDNGPEFSSNEFAEFTKQWDFKHDRSSPYYPQSNSMVERTIQNTVNRTIKKAIASHQDPYLAFLALRTTPFTNKTASPCYPTRGTYTTYHIAQRHKGNAKSRAHAKQV